MSGLSTDTAIVGFLGLGNMGGAIAQGLLKSGFPAERLVAFDVDQDKLDAFAGQTVDSIGALSERCDAVIVAVKPYLLGKVLPSLTADVSLVISVAAGTQIETIRAVCGDNVKAVVRSMPNTAASVCASTSALVAEEGTSDDARDLVEYLFAAVGEAVWLPNESLMHAATAVVGSGPAFIYVLAEALADAAVLNGMPRPSARRAAASMLRGAGELLCAHDGSPAELKDAVASPGGTTIAGLCTLEETGFRASVIAAISATVQRSEELA